MKLESQIIRRAINDYRHYAALMPIPNKRIFINNLIRSYESIGVNYGRKALAHILKTKTNNPNWVSPQIRQLAEKV